MLFELVELIIDIGMRLWRNQKKNKVDEKNENVENAIEQSFERFEKFENALEKNEGRENKLDSADVTINGDFVGVIFEDNEDGDTCYHFNMTILDLDIN